MDMVAVVVLSFALALLTGALVYMLLDARIDRLHRFHEERLSRHIDRHPR